MTSSTRVPGRGLDPDYLRHYSRALEDAGFDYTLVPYGSSGADSFVVATAVAAATESIKPIVALRPNTVFPTVAAQQLATLDQLSTDVRSCTSSPAAATPSRPARATS